MKGSENMDGLAKIVGERRKNLTGNSIICYKNTICKPPCKILS